MKAPVKFGLFLGTVALLTAAPVLVSGQDKTSTNKQDTTGGSKKGLRVFFASHSLLWYAPNPIGDLAKAAGFSDHKLVGHQKIGGSKTEQHWDMAEGQNQAKKALRSGDVDVFVMSPKQFPDQGIENFVKLGLEHNPNMHFTVQISWSQSDADPLNLPKGVPPGFDREKDPEHLKKVLAANIKAAEAQADDINKRHGKGRKVLFLVPSAQASIALRIKIYNKQLPGLTKQGELFIDNVHGTAPLEALNTYLHFAALYHHSPVGLPMASMLKNAKKASYDEKFNRTLQELSWEIVSNYPYSGVTVAPAKKGK